LTPDEFVVQQAAVCQEEAVLIGRTSL